MENIDQINDMKEKLNDLASTFTEQLTIHEEQEKAYEPSQESVKVSKSGYIERRLDFRALQRQEKNGQNEIRIRRWMRLT